MTFFSPSHLYANESICHGFSNSITSCSYFELPHTQARAGAVSMSNRHIFGVIPSLGLRPQTWAPHELSMRQPNLVSGLVKPNRHPWIWTTFGMQATAHR